MYDTYTGDALRAVHTARDHASTLGASHIGTEHLLLGIAGLETGQAPGALAAAGADADTLSDLASDYFSGRHAPGRAHIPFSSRALTAMEAAGGNGSTGAPELLRAILTDPQSSAVALLHMAGTGPADILAELGPADRKPSGPTRQPGTPDPARPGPSRSPDPWKHGEASPRRGRARADSAALATYGTDLVAAAAAGNLDPVIGRDDLIARTLTMLCRRTKNNPILIGDPGVGKTAIVEGVAARIAAGDAPTQLAGARLWSIDMASLVAGARYRGDFEQRLRTLIDDAVRDDATILFIDEVHTLVGAGAAEGSLDAANILKPELARGRLRLIGATTFDEYRSSIETDPALERRFGRLTVDPVGAGEAVTILEGLAPTYAAHHQVLVADSAPGTAVRLASRYLPGRHLPDSAIDLLDEAAADASVNGRSTVDDAGLAAACARLSGIPAAGADTEAGHLVAGLGPRLAAHILGQPAAVAAVTAAAVRAASGLSAPQRPAASLLFTGPTGVGKTAMAKALAAELFGDPGACLILDMGEYSEPHTVSRLLGSPPGYIGHGPGGQLTEPVRRRPHQVVVLDELDKAHRDVSDALLGMLEDGRLTDGAGRTVDFTHTIIIITTNTGTGTSSAGFAPQTGTRAASAAAAAHFRPEFVNRIDAVVPFDRLDTATTAAIASQLCDQATARAAAAGMAVTVDPQAVAALAAAGADPVFGARPMRRAVTDLVETPLAVLLLAGARQAHVGVGPDGAVRVT